MFSHEVLRWTGVAYLLYLGLSYWNAPPEAPGEKNRTKAAASAYGRGFATSAANPKTLLFMSAFLPQFVAPEKNVLAQMAVLSLTFMVVVGVIDVLWVALAGFTRPLLARTAAGTANRLSAVLFLAAGILLALVRWQ
jgi:homoserine/homoserine lactone efflux protein